MATPIVQYWPGFCSVAILNPLGNVDISASKDLKTPEPDFFGAEKPGTDSLRGTVFKSILA